MTGFNSKREAAADKLQEPEREALKLALEALEQLDGIDTETECVTIDVGDVIDAIKEALAQPVQSVAGYCKKIEELIAQRDSLRAALAQPAQREWIWLSDADIAEVIDTTCQYTGSYEEFLIKKAERKIRSMNNGT